MAQIIQPPIGDRNHYHGLEWIFEYTIQDGALSAWNCGQAAAATLLTHHGRMNPLKAAANMAWLERHYPPDQFGGWFGTGRQRLEGMLRAGGINAVDVIGINRIRAQLARNNPVILMLGLSFGRLLGIDLPGGHWMVAYGYDRENVYLTNGWPVRWFDLPGHWNTLTARWIRMSGRGLARRT